MPRRSKRSRNLDWARQSDEPHEVSYRKSRSKSVKRGKRGLAAASKATRIRVARKGGRASKGRRKRRR